MLCTDFLGALQQISPENPINCVQETHSNRQTAYRRSFLRKIRRFFAYRVRVRRRVRVRLQVRVGVQSSSPKFESRVRVRLRVRVPSSSSSPEFECVTWSLTSSLTNIRVCWMNNYFLRDSYFIAKCDKRYYKVRQVLLQSATGITKCDVITKCDGTIMFI